MSPVNINVVKEIIEFMRRFGGYYAEWYVGITDEPRSVLFNEHHVNEKSNSWIFKNTDSGETAKACQEYIMNYYYTDGDEDGVSDSSTYVYAYRKMPQTVP